MDYVGNPISASVRVPAAIWCIVVDGQAIGTDTPKGQAVLLFNSRELAELAIENSNPQMVGATAVEIDLVKFAPASVAAGCMFATLDYFGNRFMRVLDLRLVVEAIKRL